MDKKGGGSIDLESLRGFTQGPWRWSEVGPFTFELVAGIERVLYRRGDKTGLQHGTINADQVDGPDARLIAAAPSMHAELTARRARDAEVEALVAADLELNRAIEAAGGFVEEGYESESYGVYGSDFERCLACDAESGAGVLNKGVTHEADCVRHRYEVALERRAEALAPFTGAKP